MTAPYTSNVLNNILSAASNTGNKSVQNSNSQNVSDNGFMTALDNSLKSYTDKTESSYSSNYNNPSYAEKTKEIKNSKNQQVPEADNKPADKNTQNTENIEESSVADDTQKAENKSTDKTEKQETQDKNKIENNQKENTGSSEKNENTESDSQTPDEQPESAQNTGAQTDVILNAANESILANIEFAPQSTDTSQVTEESAETKEVDTDKTQKVSSQDSDTEIPAEIKNSDLETVLTDSEIDNPSQNKQAVTTSDKTVQNRQTSQQQEIPESTDMPEVKTDIKTSDKAVSDTTTVQKDVKTALASDNSRIVLNLEEAPVTDDGGVQETAVTPADTEPDKTPVIKVSDEVAASTKENTTSKFVENKDLTSTTKEKAVSQMTAVENTDTVVTHSQTSKQTNSEGEGSLNNKNAGEQIIKMGVDDASQPVNSENFVNRFDKTFSSATAKVSSGTQNLNSNDIMNQVNAKLEQLQNSSSSKVSIVLKPENLGRVSLEIMSSKDGIVAKMTTDNQQVKELFDKNVEALKSSLSSQGVNVNNIKVECSQESSNNAMNFERDQFNQQNTSQNQNNNNRQTSQSTEAYTNTNYTEESDIEFGENVELKNTDSIIQHNGKVDYKV